MVQRLGRAAAIVIVALGCGVSLSDDLAEHLDRISVERLCFGCAVLVLARIDPAHVALDQLRMLLRRLLFALPRRPQVQARFLPPEGFDRLTHRSPRLLDSLGDVGLDKALASAPSGGSPPGSARKPASPGKTTAPGAKKPTASDRQATAAQTKEAQIRALREQGAG